MVLIPKNKRTELIENPMRPRVGLPREHTVCKLSWGDYYIEPEETERRLQVDADHDEEFIAELEATIPKSERYRCKDKEVWLISKQWKRFIVGLAKRRFDKVITELREWD